MFVRTLLLPDINATVEIPDVLLQRMVAILFDATVISFEDLHTINPDSGITFTEESGAGIIDFDFAANVLINVVQTELQYYYQWTKSSGINRSLLIILINALYLNEDFLKVLSTSYNQAVLDNTPADHESESELELEDFIQFDDGNDDYLAHEPESLAVTQQILHTLQNNVTK